MKYADRGFSGKFVTIFPVDEDQLERILEERRTGEPHLPTTSNVDQYGNRCRRLELPQGSSTVADDASHEPLVTNIGCSGRIPAGSASQTIPSGCSSQLNHVPHGVGPPAQLRTVPERMR